MSGFLTSLSKSSTSHRQSSTYSFRIVSFVRCCLAKSCPFSFPMSFSWRCRLAVGSPLRSQRPRRRAPYTRIPLINHCPIAFEADRQRTHGALPGLSESAAGKLDRCTLLSDIAVTRAKIQDTELVSTFSLSCISSMQLD